MGNLIAILTSLMPWLVLGTLLICLAILIIILVFACKAKRISEAMIEQIRQAGQTRHQVVSTNPGPKIVMVPPKKKRKPINWEY